MIIMMHANSAIIEDGILKIDRKFLLGMNRYSLEIDASIITIHPMAASVGSIMDHVSVPCSDLEFKVIVLDESRRYCDVLKELHNLISDSELLVGGGMGSVGIARALDIPYVLVLEYDLQTQLKVTTSQVSSVVRRCIRAMRCIGDFFVNQSRDRRGAVALHCNGFPVYDESEKYNGNRLLYLDSRMSENMVISEPMLQRRLLERRNRTVRLLFSGRYEPMKGASDAIRVALECLKSGLDIEMHCYGQGSQKEEMLALAKKAVRGNRIYVHDAIPYPALVERSRNFDLFVCCHIQNDPSCTYLESFGAGLPIVGYDNRMWDRLSKLSGVGCSSPLGRPELVADSVKSIVNSNDIFDLMSIKARNFALSHTFEREFSLRTAAINEELRRRRVLDK